LLGLNKRGLRTNPFEIPWPYHCNLTSRTLSIMLATPTSQRISSLIFLFLSEALSIHLSIHISVFSNKSTSFLLDDQASAPYISTSLIIVLYTFPFPLVDIFLSQTSPASSFHFCQATAILFFTPSFCIHIRSEIPLLSRIFCHSLSLICLLLCFVFCFN